MLEHLPTEPNPDASAPKDSTILPDKTSTQPAEVNFLAVPASTETPHVSAKQSIAIRISKIGGGIVLATAMLMGAGYAVHFAAHDAVHNRPEDEGAVREVTRHIAEFKEAIKACEKTPNEETAEKLNTASKMATSCYLITRTRLGSKRDNLHLLVYFLHEMAVEALAKATPRTRRIAHYEERVHTRRLALMFKGMKDENEFVKTLKDSIARGGELNKKLETMTPEEKERYWRELVAEGTPKKK